MKVGLYKLTVKQTPERGELKFYNRIGEAEIESPALTITAKDWDGEEASYELDKAFSKEAGHYAYVRTQKDSLTPFDPDLLQLDTGEASGKPTPTDRTAKKHTSRGGRKSSKGDTTK